MADTEVTWSGLILGGDTGYILSEVSGWDDLPEITSYDQARARGHGDHVGGQFARARTVTVSGKVADVSGRDEMVRALQAASLVSSAVEDLTLDFMGQELLARARLIRRSVGVGLTYSVGEVPFALQWRCPDPLRYGPLQAAASTGLPTSGGGLAYPLTYPLDYGAAGDPGRITLTNDGTASAPIVFEVTGPLPSGFELSAGGARLRYPVEVPAGQVLTIDTGSGTVLVEGTADRRGNLTVADWFQVAPSSSLSVQFTSLGGAYSSAARLSVPGFRSAFW